MIGRPVLRMVARRQISEFRDALGNAFYQFGAAAVRTNSRCIAAIVDQTAVIATIMVVFPQTGIHSVIFSDAAVLPPPEGQSAFRKRGGFQRHSVVFPADLVRGMRIRIREILEIPQFANAVGHRRIRRQPQFNGGDAGSQGGRQYCGQGIGAGTEQTFVRGKRMRRHKQRFMRRSNLHQATKRQMGVLRTQADISDVSRHFPGKFPHGVQIRQIGKRMAHAAALFASLNLGAKNQGNTVVIQITAAALQHQTAFIHQTLDIFLHPGRQRIHDSDNFDSLAAQRGVQNRPNRQTAGCGDLDPMTGFTDSDMDVKIGEILIHCSS